MDEEGETQEYKIRRRRSQERQQEEKEVEVNVIVHFYSAVKLAARESRLRQVRQ